jgi:hypothetical protein
MGTNLVTAAGSETKNHLDLRVVTLGDPALIRLSLNLATSPVQGSYAASTPAGLADRGVASGGRSALAGSDLTTGAEVATPDLAR